MHYWHNIDSGGNEGRLHNSRSLCKRCYDIITPGGDLLGRGSIHAAENERGDNEYGKYRILYHSGWLKECLDINGFKCSWWKKAETVINRIHKKSIREVLAAIFMLGGQKGLFCNSKQNVTKTTVYQKRIILSAPGNVTSRGCEHSTPSLHIRIKVS